MVYRTRSGALKARKRLSGVRSLPEVTTIKQIKIGSKYHKQGLRAGFYLQPVKRRLKK